MIIKFKVKVKGAPEFKEGLGEGVVAEHTFEYPDDASTTQLAVAILNKKTELMEEYFEVTAEQA